MWPTDPGGVELDDLTIGGVSVTSARFSSTVHGLPTPVSGIRQNGPRGAEIWLAPLGGLAVTDVDGSGAVGAGGAAGSAVRAVREIITAAVVHRDAARADSLIGEYLTAYGRGLIDAASTFIACHLTDATTPELAEDRFLYLLTRIGNLVDLAAEVTGVDPGEIVLEVAQGQAQLEDLDVDESVRQAYRAAQTCLVAHRFVRLGRPAWGIQQSLNQADMLVVNSSLAGMLCVIAGAVPEETRATAFVVLLGEDRHILSCQAKARWLATSPWSASLSSTSPRRPHRSPATRLELCETCSHTDQSRIGSYTRLWQH